MKKITFWLFAFVFCTMTWQMNAQVFVNENFDSGTPSGWSDSYSNTSSQTCSGNSERDNLYSGSTTGNLTSPNLVGVSNETDLTFSFDYKVVNWSAATTPTPAGWGTTEFQYSLDDGANWTTALTINDDNHVVSSECANMGGVIPAASLPEGSDVKLRIYNTWSSGDYYFYVDNFVASQEIVLPPNCDAGLAFPADGAVNAPTTGDISWDVATGAPLGYSLTVGATSGGSEVFSGDVGNVTSYSLGTLDPGTMYYVSIVPYNDNGDATECSEYSFTTVAMPTCTANLVATPDPECGNIGSTSLTWDALDIADGYYLNLGTTPGGTDVYNNEDLGDVTMYSVSGDLQDAGITYYWTILPYNTAGVAVDCTEETYTTEATFCYCIPDGDSTATYIDSFSTTNAFSDIENLNSGLSADNYGDYYETYTVNSYAEGSFDFSVVIVGGTVGCAVWVDWNNDFEFDTTEVSFSTTSYGSGPFNNSILVPAGTPNGDYRMRVMIDWNDSNPGDDSACELAFGRGEVEDYKLVVEDAPECTFAEMGAAIVPDCDSDQFYVDVLVTSFGDLDSLTDGTQTQSVNDAQPLYNFGPYPNGTEVTITAEHTDAACDFEVGTWEYSCPPENDTCEVAEMLTVGVSIDAFPVDGTVLNATEDAEPNDCGSNGPGVWYAVEVPSDGSVIIETAADSNGTTGFDSVIEAFSGTCGALTSIDCDDDGADTGNYSLLELNGLTPGETIYIRVWEYGGNETEPFSISAYNEALSIDSYSVLDSFSYYPNPVENSLTIKSQQSIEKVEVYNTLGQIVITNLPNNTNPVLDMNQLKSGTYFVKVSINGLTETIRIVKK